LINSKITFDIYSDGPKKFIKKFILKPSSRGYFCVLASHGFSLSLINERFNSALNDSIVNVPDGKPIALYASFKYKKNVPRMYGPDLMVSILEELNKFKGKKVFFVGGNRLLKKLIISKTKTLFKNVIVSGFDTRIININKTSNLLISKINKNNPDIVFVGIGCPKQELWMSHNYKKINSLLIGVGAAFDFYAGNKKQAPIWIQNLYLEWLFRLFQEPKRLFSRYLTYNSIFVFHCCCMAIKFLCNKVCKK